MRVLAIQLHVEKGKVHENYERAYNLLELGIKLYQPDVVLFPEGFAVYGASADMNPLAEDVPGPATDRFCHYSRAHGLMILFGLARRDPAGRGLYNSVVLIDQGQILGTYDKTHLVMECSPERRATDNEQEIYSPGRKLGLFDTRFGRIGVMICFDGEFPEVPRSLVLQGARAIFWLMNCGDRSTVAKLNARWNLVPFFTCNRVRIVENGERRGGGSIFVDAHGEPFDVAGSAESFVFAKVDLEEQAKFKAGGISNVDNVYRVRRTDLYEPISQGK